MINKSDFHTIDKWDVPRSGTFNIIVDEYWCVDENNNPLFYGSENYPQCNKDINILNKFAKEAKIKKIPIVYVPFKVKYEF